MISFRDSTPGARPSEDESSRKFYEKLRELIGSNDFQAWFATTPCRLETPTRLVLNPDNSFRCKWIRHIYESQIKRAASLVLGSEAEVVFRSPGVKQTPRPPGKGRKKKGFAGRSQPTNPANTFANFVTGPATRVAHAACLAVTEHPGSSYNPLVICGEAGTGKSHLLQALNRSLIDDSHRRPLYLSAENFTNQFLDGGSRSTALRSDLTHADALLIDDIHFFADKKRTQEEVFVVTEQMIRAGKPVIFSSLLPPDEIEGLDRRLQSLIQEGLAALLAAPDMDTRFRILFRKALLQSFELPVEVAQFLAHQVGDNLRHLEGCLTHLIHLTRVHECLASLELATEALESVQPGRRNPAGSISIDQIFKKLEEHFGMKQKQLLSSSKVRTLVYVRQIGMFLAREMTPLSLEQIGLRFGGKDHTTVLYAQGRIRQQLEKSAKVRADLQILRKQLTRAP